MSPPWRLTLAQLIERGPVPSRWSILSLEVQHSYWDVLAYEHDGMAKEAARAREGFNRCVEQLRDAYDTHPGLGTDAADEMTDRAIQQARAKFADALRQEGQVLLFGQGVSEWRTRRGKPRAYF